MSKFNLKNFLATITIKVGFISVSYPQYIKQLKKTI
jgi:hypothetical protein